MLLRTILLSIGFSLLAALSVTAQDIETRIQHRRLGMLQGELLSYAAAGDSLRLKLYNGTIYTLTRQDVRRVVQQVQKAPKGHPKQTQRMDSLGNHLGWYRSFSAGALLGRAPTRENCFVVGGDVVICNDLTLSLVDLFGYSIQATMGYKWSRWASLGGGVSLDVYNPQTKERVLNLVGEYRANLTQGRLPLYLLIGSGIGVPVQARSNRSARANENSLTGILFHPALGIQFGEGGNTRLAFELGYQVQEVNYEGFDDRNGVRIRRVNYQRIVVRTVALF